MGLRINTNANAITALTNLRKSDAALSSSLERLSSGLRINRASDDPAGLVVSEQFRTQIGSLRQAVENTQFSSNLISTAEAALQEISDLLIDVRESVVFAKNTGGVSDEQIAAEQDSVDSAVAAIDRIAATTRFGRSDLLNGASDFVTSATAGVTDLTVRSVFQATNTATFTATIVSAASQATVAINSVASAAGGAGITLRVTGELGSEDVTFAGSNVTQAALATAINNLRDFTGVFASGGAAFSTSFGADTAIQIDVVAGSAAGGGGFGRDDGNDANLSLNGAQVNADGLDVRVNSSFLKAEFTIAGASNVAGTALEFSVTDFSGLVFQLGSEPSASDQVRIGVQAVDSSRLGFSTITQTTGAGGLTIGGFLSSVSGGGGNDLQQNPDNAIRIVDRSLDQINGLRGFLGALEQQTLEPNERSLAVAIENLTSSESAVRDLDFAAETTVFTRNQILFNAGTSVLGTSNLVPQQVLALLG